MIHEIEAIITPGTLFKVAASEVLELTDGTGIRCCFMFNGLHLKVNKGDSLISIANQYDKFIHDSSISIKD